MSQESGGPGWWMASDGKWYPPESRRPDLPPPPPSTADATSPTLPPTDATSADPSAGERAPKKPWWRRWWVIVLGVLVLLIVLIAIFAEPPEDEDAEEVAPVPTATTLEQAAAEPVATSNPGSSPNSAAAVSTETADTSTTDSVSTAATEPAPTTVPATVAPVSTIVVTTTVASTTTTTLPPVPVNFQGAGTDVLTLDAGDPIATEARALIARHEGSSNFIVTALDADGNRVDGLINHIGAYAGSRPWNFSGSEIAFIEVEADGPWELQLIPLLGIPSVSTTSGTTFDGQSDQILIFTNSGPSVVDFVCSDCSSNIIVTAWGPRRDGLINEIGDGTSFSSSVIVPADTFILEVQTSDSDFSTGQFIPGDWSLTVQ